MKLRAWFTRAADAVPARVWVGIWTFVGGATGYLVHVLETSSGAALIDDLSSWHTLRSILVSAIATGLITLWSTVKLPTGAVRGLPPQQN